MIVLTDQNNVVVYSTNEVNDFALNEFGDLMVGENHYFCRFSYEKGYVVDSVPDDIQTAAYEYTPERGFILLHDGVAVEDVKRIKDECVDEIRKGVME